jgi:hypothetical protein
VLTIALHQEIRETNPKPSISYLLLPGEGFPEPIFRLATSFQPYQRISPASAKHSFDC